MPESNPLRDDCQRQLELLEKYAALHTLRPLEEWHEDFGSVLWHHLPIQETPYVGSGPGMNESNADGTPTDCRRLIESGWLTHWSPLPSNPRMPGDAIE